MDANQIEKEAREILREEQRRAAVAKAVERLRSRRSIWDRFIDLIPFTITIKRKSNGTH